MVKSGLVNEPKVSHFRLAAHLGLALICLIYLFILSAHVWPRRFISRSLWKAKGLSVAICLITFTQILFGALTAGLHAGLVHNTFPDMNGRLIGSGAFSMNPFWLNLFENPVAVQFVHRSFAWTICALVVVYIYKVYNNPSSKLQKQSALFFFAALLIQFSLGVATLLNYVPINLASMHQAGAVMLMIAALFAYIQNRDRV